MNPNANPTLPEEAAVPQQLRINSLSVRLKLLLLAETKERGRYSSLEAHTDIPAATWRTWWNRGGVPGGQLVEAAAKTWPQFAFWLVTGHTDIRCGHDMPPLAIDAQGYITNWPEQGVSRSKPLKNGYSQQYLKLSTQLDGTESPANSIDDRMHIETLRIVSSRRLAEIAENFKMPMAFEIDN